MADSYYKSSDQVLVAERDVKIRAWDSPRRYAYVFDFEFRIMAVITNYSGAREATETHPFPNLDPGLLQRMRDKLIELGGEPLPLCDQKKTLPPPLGVRKKEGPAP